MKVSNKVGSSEVIKLVDELNETYKPKDSRLNSFRLVFEDEPRSTREAVATTALGGLLRQEDTPFASSEFEDYILGVTLSVRDADLASAALLVWKNQYPYYSKNMAGEFVTDGSEHTYELSFQFGYVNGKQFGTESAGVALSDTRPDLIRGDASLFCLEYSETGYEGHSFQNVDIDSESALRIVRTIRGLVGKP